MNTLSINYILQDIFNTREIEEIITEPPIILSKINLIPSFLIKVKDKIYYEFLIQINLNSFKKEFLAAPVQYLRIQMDFFLKEPINNEYLILIKNKKYFPSWKFVHFQPKILDMGLDAGLKQLRIYLKYNAQSDLIQTLDEAKVKKNLKLLKLYWSDIRGKMTYSSRLYYPLTIYYNNKMNACVISVKSLLSIRNPVKKQSYNFNKLLPIADQVAEVIRDYNK